MMRGRACDSASAAQQHARKLSEQSRVVPEVVERIRSLSPRAPVAAQYGCGSDPVVRA